MAAESAGTVVVMAVSNDKLLRARCAVNHVTTQSLGSLLDNVERRRTGRASLFDWPSMSTATGSDVAVPAGDGVRAREENRENIPPFTS